MINPSCKFHPEIPAVAKCQDCGEWICHQCVNKFIDENSRYSTSSNLCPKCNLIKVERKYNSLYLLFPLILPIGMLIWLLSIEEPGTRGPTIFWFGVFIISYILWLTYRFKIAGPREISIAKKKRDEIKW